MNKRIFVYVGKASGLKKALEHMTEKERKRREPLIFNPKSGI